MRRTARFLVRLYPARWRARYGAEFLALLEDAPPGWPALFDLAKGAMRMQLTTLSFTKLALALSLAGLGTGFGASFLITPRYLSSAELIINAGRFDAPVPPHRNLTDYFLEMKNEVMSRTALSRVIQNPRLDLYKSDRAVLPLEDVIEAMRKRAVRIEPVVQPGLSSNDTFAFTVSFDYSNARRAQDVVQTLITEFQDINLNRQRETAQAQDAYENDVISRFDARISAIERKLGITSPELKPRFIDTFQKRPAFNSGIQVEVLDPPSLPELPVFPNRAVFAASGFGAGFSLTIVVLLLRRRPVAPVSISA